MAAVNRATEASRAGACRSTVVRRNAECDARPGAKAEPMRRTRQRHSGGLGMSLRRRRPAARAWVSKGDALAARARSNGIDALAARARSLDSDAQRPGAALPGRRH